LSDRPCAAGAACIDGRCSSGGALGDACDDAMHATFGPGDTCADGLACDHDTKRCANPTFGAPGDRCDDEALLCSHGFCATVTNDAQCFAFKTVGAACDASDVRDRCEGLAQCRGGICQLDDPAACR
jgi:hypothetical protein